MIARPEWAALALILYVAALGIFLKWATDRAETLSDDDPRGLSDAERAELRLINPDHEDAA